MASSHPPPPLQDHLLNTPKRTFYVTVVHELRADTDHYMYSIDRCHTNLAQANERLSFLSRCNTVPANRETLSAGVDEGTAGRWCGWSRSGDEKGGKEKDGPVKFRFLAEVKPMVMHGDLLTTGPVEDALSPAAAASTTMAQIRYLFERRKDLAHHVWAVAIHHAERQPGPAPTKISTTSEKPATDGAGPPTLSWTLESLHPVSGNALARAKRLWTEQLLAEKGRFDRLDLHYGFARYILLPLSTTVKFVGKTAREIKNLQVERESQVRVERIRVTPEWEMVAPFAPAEAVLPRRKWEALCPERVEKPPLRENVGFAALEKEFNEIVKDFPSSISSVVTSEGLTEESWVKSSEDGTLVAAVGGEEEKGTKKTPTPVFLPFVGQPYIGTQRAPFRPNVVREYGSLALQMRERQEEKMEEIVNKSQNSHRWSLTPNKRSSKSFNNKANKNPFFAAGGPSSSPSAADYAALKASLSTGFNPPTSKPQINPFLNPVHNVTESGSPRERTKGGPPRELKGKGRVRFAVDDFEEAEKSGTPLRRRMSVKRYAGGDESGSKRASWMGGLM